jgi:hypothetical protein
MRGTHVLESTEPRINQDSKAKRERRGTHTLESTDRVRNNLGRQGKASERGALTLYRVHEEGQVRSVKERVQEGRHSLSGVHRGRDKSAQWNRASE